MTRSIRFAGVSLVLAALLSVPDTALGQGSFSNQAANQYVQAHDWNGLLQYSMAWTRARPKDPSGWFYLGNTYGAGLNDPGHALPALQNAVALKPSWIEAWNALGHVQAQLEQNDDAVKSFIHVVQLSPTWPGYWNNLAAAYSRANRISKAVDALETEQRVAAASMTFGDWYNLGNGFLTMQEFKPAANAYRQALRMKKDYGPAWTNLGTLEGMQGNNSAALDDYRRAAALGDPLGAEIVTRIENAMAAAREARSEDPMKAFWRGQAHELERRAQLAWQARLAAAQTP